MSAIRNIHERRAHRERAQVAGREKLGILEKHKDYQARARDYNKKNATLKSLRAKAADRNEDEFYHGMLSRKLDLSSNGKKWSGTVAADRGNKVLDIDTSRLLKTQDTGYLRTMRNVAAKEVAELEQKEAIARSFLTAGDGHLEREEDDDMMKSDEDEWDGVETSSSGRRRKSADKSRPIAKRIIFADGREDLEEKAATTTTIIRTPKPKVSKTSKGAEDDVAPRISKVEVATKLRKKLDMARKKLKALSTAENELDLQRARMAKTATVGGFSSRTGKQIKVRERKR